MSYIRTWEPEELDIVRKLQEQNASDIVVALNAAGWERTIESVRKCRQRRIYPQRIESEPMLASPVSAAAPITTGAIPKAPTVAQKRAATAERHRVYNEILDAQNDLHARTPDKRRKRKVARGPLGGVVVFGDTHFGKEITEQGHALFNLDLARRRWRSLIDYSIDRLDLHAKAEGLDEVVVATPGDLLDGAWIYETQPHHIEAGILEQFKVASECIWDLLSALSDRWPTRFVGAWGNHGRMPSAESDNFDNLLYVHLETCAKRAKLPVEIQWTLDKWTTFDLKGKRGYIRHKAPKGDGTAAPKAKIGGWAYKRQFDFMLTGHIHSARMTHYMDKPIFRTGSLGGYDDLADDMAEYAPGSQLVLGVSQDRVPAFYYPITFPEVE